MMRPRFGVVLGVRARHQNQVERQAKGVSAYPDVPFLQDVEQRHLDTFGQVWKFVEAEDTPVGPWHQPEVDGFRVPEGPPFRNFHRVDVADQVAHTGVRRGQLLPVALAAVPPGHGQVVAQFRGEAAAARAGGLVGMVVDLAARYRRRPFVEQRGQGADEPRLALAPLTEQDRVVPGEECPFQVREHGLAEADDPGEPVLARPHPGQQVLANFLFDRHERVAAGPEFSQRGYGGTGRRVGCGVALVV